MTLGTVGQVLATKILAALPPASQPGTIAGVNVDEIKNIFLFGVVPVAGLIIMAGMIFNARKAKASDNAITLTNVIMALGVGFLCVGGAAWAIASAAAGAVTK